MAGVFEVFIGGLDAKAIGPYGVASDVTVTTRFGDSPCGMYEMSWTMPLPEGFQHPSLRRGSLVEFRDCSWRLGSSLVLTEPTPGTGLSEPWELTAFGVGQEVGGDSSWLAMDNSLNPTGVPSVAIDRAIANGLSWAGRDASIPTVAVSEVTGFSSIGALLNVAADQNGRPWGVGRDNVVRLLSYPTTPKYHVVPDVGALGSADDSYASVIFARYIGLDAVTRTVRSPTAASALEARYQRREAAADLTAYGQISSSQAQAYADAIYAQYGGRLGWSEGLTVTSEQILTSGGMPADLSKVLEDVGDGVMVRLHGTFPDFLTLAGAPWLDIIIGEAKWVVGESTISLSPMGAAARDLASVLEQVAGPPPTA